MTRQPAPRRIFSAISRTRTGKALIQLGETRAISAQTVETEAAFKAELSKAKYFRRRSRHEEALTRFRRALLVSPTESHTWVDYGHAGINCGRPSLAYEAFLNALELHPRNVGALEMANDLAPKLGLTPVETRRLLSNASKHAVADKPARHLELLDFFIPHGTPLPAEVFEKTTNTSARALFALQVNEDADNSALKSLAEPDRTAVLARFYLLRGRYSAAEKALNKLTPEAIPVNTLRRMARRLSNAGNHQKVKFSARHLLRANRHDKWARQKLESAEASYRTSSAASEKRTLLDSGFPLP